MVRCVVKTRRMIFVVKNYQVNVPIFCRVQLVVNISRKMIFWKKIQRGWDLLQGEVATIAIL